MLSEEINHPIQTIRVRWAELATERDPEETCVRLYVPETVYNLTPDEAVRLACQLLIVASQIDRREKSG